MSDLSLRVLSPTSVNTHKQAIAKGFNKAASQYNQNALIQKEIADETLKRFANVHTNKVSTLIDLGCGTAMASASLLPRTAMLLGVDIAFDMLITANYNVQRYADNKKIVSKNIKRQPVLTHFTSINADAEYLPFKNNSIEAVYSSMALQWCTSPAQVLCEIQRVLAPNGKALLGILVGESFSQLHHAWHALNKPSRINRFHASQSWINAAMAHKWQCRFERQTFTSSHVNILSMLKAMKHVGANTQLNHSGNGQVINKNAQALPRYLGKAEIAALDQQLILAQNLTSESVDSVTVPAVSMLLDYEILFIEINKTEAQDIKL